MATNQWGHVKGIITLMERETPNCWIGATLIAIPFIPLQCSKHDKRTNLSTLLEAALMSRSLLNQ